MRTFIALSLVALLAVATVAEAELSVESDVALGRKLLGKKKGVNLAIADSAAEAGKRGKAAAASFTLTKPYFSKSAAAAKSKTKKNKAKALGAAVAKGKNTFTDASTLAFTSKDKSVAISSSTSKSSG